MLAKIAAKEEELKKAKEQAEQEKREVEAYEKRRAEKLAKEAQEKAELEKIAAQARATEKALNEKEAAEKKAEHAAKSIDVDAEKKAAKDAADMKYWEAIQEMRKAQAGKIAVAKTSIEQEIPAKKTETTDIDLDAEKKAARDAANKTYLEAVQEMNQAQVEKIVVAKASVEQEIPAKKAETTDIDLDAEKKAARDAADKTYFEAVQEMNQGQVEKIAVAKTSVEHEIPAKKAETTDIDLDAEKKAAKDAADKAYLEAVQEMNQAE